MDQKGHSNHSLKLVSKLIMKLGIKYFLIAIILLAGLSCADNESITHGITGTWKWTYTCGGITGVCGYADESNTRTLEITQDKIIKT